MKKIWISLGVLVLAVALQAGSAQAEEKSGFFGFNKKKVAEKKGAVVKEVSSKEVKAVEKSDATDLGNELKDRDEKQEIPQIPTAPPQLPNSPSSRGTLQTVPKIPSQPPTGPTIPKVPQPPAMPPRIPSQASSIPAVPKNAWLEHQKELKKFKKRQLAEDKAKKIKDDERK